MNKIEELKKENKTNWSGICALDDNRNQCSEKNCILFPSCKIKIPYKKAESHFLKEVEGLSNFIMDEDVGRRDILERLEELKKELGGKGD